MKKTYAPYIVGLIVSIIVPILALTVESGEFSHEFLGHITYLILGLLIAIFSKKLSTSILLNISAILLSFYVFGCSQSYTKCQDLGEIPFIAALGASILIVVIWSVYKIIKKSSSHNRN